MMTHVPTRYWKLTLNTPSLPALLDARMVWLPWTCTSASANGDKSLLSKIWTFIWTSVKHMMTHLTKPLTKQNV